MISHLVMNNIYYCYVLPSRIVMIGRSTLCNAAAISRYTLLLESRLARHDKHVVVDSFVEQNTWM